MNFILYLLMIGCKSAFELEKKLIYIWKWLFLKMCDFG